MKTNLPLTCTKLISKVSSSSKCIWPLKRTKKARMIRIKMAPRTSRALERQHRTCRHQEYTTWHSCTRTTSRSPTTSTWCRTEFYPYILTCLSKTKLHKCVNKKQLLREIQIMTSLSRLSLANKEKTVHLSQPHDISLNRNEEALWELQTDNRSTVSLLGTRRKQGHATHYQ